eukprot:jgi/Botrbrau1/1981/Bobra.0052s0024.1
MDLRCAKPMFHRWAMTRHWIHEIDIVGILKKPSFSQHYLTINAQLVYRCIDSRS